MSQEEQKARISGIMHSTFMTPHQSHPAREIWREIADINASMRRTNEMVARVLLATFGAKPLPDKDVK